MVSPRGPQLTVAVPVYRSAGHLEATIDRIAVTLTARARDFEILLVDDGSPDGVFAIIRECAARDARVRGLRLGRNCGQHTALLCALAAARGEYVVALDDDLQNPPESIEALLEVAERGHDLVFGRIRASRQPWWRRVASGGFRALVRPLLGVPPGVHTSNLWLAEGDLARRAVRTASSWAQPGTLLLRLARAPASTWVEHAKPAGGGSRYGLAALLALAGRIVCHHTAVSARVLSLGAALLATASFAIAAWGDGWLRHAGAAAGAGLAGAALFALLEARRPRLSPEERVVERCGVEA